MIPAKLELKNFLPYRSPDPLYFEGIHLACLTGDNGAGKSSLLDAITWVLWGEARGRRDDDLIHLGREEMYVQLDFEQESVAYRVLRRRKGGRRGQSELHFFVMQDDGTPRTLNEPSIRQTQSRINEVLRLDYDTFINSAFLKQGEADSFTTKSPAQRKKILSDILGLEQWAQYEERAKEKLKELDRTLASITGALENIEEELAKEPSYLRDKETAEKMYAIAENSLQEAEARLTEVADAPADLRNAQDQQISMNRRLKNFDDDLVTVEKDIKQREAAIAEYKEVINLAGSIEEGYSALQEARDADSSLGAKLREMSDLESAYAQYEKELAAAKSELEAERRAIETTIQETERLLSTDSSETLAQVQVEIANLEVLESERDALQGELANLREERSGLDAHKQVLTDEGQVLNERIATLENAEGALCPLCGQPLDEAHREKILAEVIAERDEKRDHWVQARDRINEIGAQEKEHKAQIEAIGVEVAALPKLRNQAGSLQKEVDDAAAAQVRLDEAQAQLEALANTLDQEDYAHEIRQQLAQLDETREAIGYDREAHENIQTQLSEYREYERQFTQLQVARETLPREQDALMSAIKRKERIELAMAEEREASDALAIEIDRLRLLVEEHQRRTQEVATQRTAATQARERVIVAEQQLNALEQQRERKQNYQTRYEEAEQEQALYQELRLAFGKNGVPAMIIDSAIPELEQSANEMLARMTNGRMHVRFSTQRAKVSGGTMETLDIDIADDLGTRPYEMYSGGEAFRINFAIRVALSKMLARRSGAHLRTLFIDEGFGTQDDDGRNKLVEAITAIQSDFDLILVITHIAELRDAFPVHVVVAKTANGSMVNIQ